MAADDRIVVFFAGHGHTVTGRRGETGFLVPVDGDPSDLSTLIRWDEFARNAELIPAKHVLFLMDACYGGLLLTRTTIPPGSTRLLKDMLQRYSRQVLTAGKADEVVSDGGGKRPGHSIFTSSVLDGLEGGAAGSDGIVTGNGLMAYVYSKVGNDPQSQQTPHYGFLDGDGDLIFDVSALSKLNSSVKGDDPEPERDLLIKTPTFALAQERGETVADTLKRLISTQGDRIQLHDFISTLLKKSAHSLETKQFPADTDVSAEELAKRLAKYEASVADLEIAAALLAHWGNADHLKLLAKILARLGELEKPLGGRTVWIELNWYPVLALMYVSGIAAIAADRYDALKVVLLTNLQGDARTDEKEIPVIVPTVDRLADIADAWKALPGLEQKFVPRSEHLFKKVQPILEDQFFLGKTYEQYFDEFEIFLALVFADIRPSGVFGIWGPPGRFAWKERRRFGGGSVFSKFVADAKAKGPDWPPLKAGLFNGSSARFAEIADGYAQLLTKLNWH